MKPQPTKKPQDNTAAGVIFLLMGAYGTYQLVTGRYELTADPTSYFPAIAPIVALVGLVVLIAGLMSRPSNPVYKAPAMQSPAAPVQKRTAPQGPPLNPEDRKFVALLAAGYGDEEIAEELRITPHRMQELRTGLYRRFGVNQDVDVIHEARRAGHLQAL